ncbi:unnamed protein product [Prunus armeniaca]
MEQSDSMPVVKYECNLGKRLRRCEGNNSGKRHRRCEVGNSRKLHRCCEGKNSGKRRRCCEGKNEGKNEGEKGVYNFLVDKISEMPDEILVSILSLLSLKEATATSILSRRWQFVWMSTTFLNFLANNYDTGKNIYRFILLKKEKRYLESGMYVNWVNRVVEQHKGPKIEEFRVCFQLNSRFRSSIDKWIQIAMEKGVETLVLKFSLQNSVGSKKMYAFPHKLLGLEKRNLHSHLPSLRPCGYKIGFHNLKVLLFKCVDVTDEVLEYLLSNCPVLEQLTVSETKSLVNIRVVHPSVTLKHLVIKYCCALKSIEISGANIISFMYRGVVMNLLLSNVPLLVEVSLSHISLHPASIKLYSSQLSCYLSQLEILMLDITGSVYDQEHVFPTLANLKHLELILFAEYRLALHHLTSFLKASPFLQRLALKLDFSLHIDGRKIKKAATCPHHYLKLVEIVGYRACASAVEHIKFLIKSATALEKIVIDPVRRWKYPIEKYPSEMDRGSKEVIEEAKAREHAMQLRFLLRIEKIQCQLGYTIMVSAIWSAQIGTSAAALKALWTIETHI